MTFSRLGSDSICLSLDDTRLFFYFSHFTGSTQSFTNPLFWDERHAKFIIPLV